MIKLRLFSKDVKLILTGIFLFSAGSIYAQYSYGLKPTGFLTYKESLEKHPENELVDLETVIPGLVMDIRYATTNNFTGQQIYHLAKAYARKPVAAALVLVQEDFRAMGWGIKMYDAYRPYKATVRFYELYHDTTYVASPYRGSRHNRGCAVDMTVVNLATGKELNMPTGYDSFSKDAWPSTPAKDPEASRNRMQLIRVMEKHGFKVNASEWWHFDFVGWQHYAVLDIDFEQLQK